MNNSTPTRFHDLDALRAFAMTLGIFFHAAWLFIPNFFFTPYPDAAATNWMFYFFSACHTFRMQLFFLVAGFFGNLLLQKRGAIGFIRNRTQRIAVPLFVFGFILVPLSYYQLTLGGLASGRIASDRSVWGETLFAMSNATVSTVVLLHLWFLYYLLLLYAVTLLTRVVLDVMAPLRNRIGIRQLAFERFARSPFPIPILVGISATLMMFSRGWWGIDSPVEGFKPNLRILAEFWIFFGFGWLLFGSQHLMEQLAKNYRWKLGLGAAMTVPLFLWMQYGNEHGYSTWQYPALDSIQIADRQKLRMHLLDQNNELSQQVFHRLPRETQRLIENNQRLSEHQLAGLAVALNVFVLLAPERFDERTVDGDGKLDARETILANRLSLEACLPGSLHSDDRTKANYWPIRAVYSVLYSTSMWLLVLGTLGLFRTYFGGFHPVVRYWSDSSYWMYLIHINVLFAIQFVMGDLRWHWFAKFVIYLLVCFAVMLSSYRYLVRGTWVGVLLNGRRSERLETQPGHVEECS